MKDERTIAGEQSTPQQRYDKEREQRRNELRNSQRANGGALSVNVSLTDFSMQPPRRRAA